MKILLVGNHTCGNRGDGAILRGLIDSIHAARSDIEIDAISRYPTSSGYLLQQDIQQDSLFLHNKSGEGADRHGKAQGRQPTDAEHYDGASGQRRAV